LALLLGLPDVDACSMQKQKEEAWGISSLDLWHNRHMGHGKLKGSLGWKGSLFSTVKCSEIGEFCRNWGFALETILGTYELCTSSSRAQNFNFTMFRL